METIYWILLVIFSLVIVSLLIVWAFSVPENDRLQPTESLTFPQQQLNQVYSGLGQTRIDQVDAVTPGEIILSTGQIITLRNLEGTTVYLSVNQHPCPGDQNLFNAIGSVAETQWRVNVVGTDVNGFQVVQLQELTLFQTNPNLSFLGQCLGTGRTCCAYDGGENADSNAVVGLLAGGASNWSVYQVKNSNLIRLRNLNSQAFLGLCNNTSCSTSQNVDPYSNAYTSNLPIGCRSAWKIDLITGPPLQQPASPQEVLTIRPTILQDVIELQRPPTILEIDTLERRQNPVGPNL